MSAVQPGWTVRLAANPTAEHTIHTSYADDQIRTVVLDEVTSVKFGPRSFTAGFRHSGLDEHGTRWTIDRTTEKTSRSGWSCETGIKGAILGRFAPGESLETLSGGRDQYLVRRQAATGVDIPKNSYFEFFSMAGHRKQLNGTPAEIAELELKAADLAQRLEQLRERMRVDRWVLGQTPATQLRVTDENKVFDPSGAAVKLFAA